MFSTTENSDFVSFIALIPLIFIYIYIVFTIDMARFSPHHTENGQESLTISIMPLP